MMKSEDAIPLDDDNDEDKVVLPESDHFSDSDEGDSKMKRMDFNIAASMDAPQDENKSNDHDSSAANALLRIRSRAYPGLIILPRASSSGRHCDESMPLTTRGSISQSP
jgi:hypothetical protein